MVGLLGIVALRISVASALMPWPRRSVLEVEAVGLEVVAQEDRLWCPFVALLGDFEWEDEASRTNYIALMVTPHLRRPLKAPVPLAVLPASAPGSGKPCCRGDRAAGRAADRALARR